MKHRLAELSILVLLGCACRERPDPNESPPQALDQAGEQTLLEGTFRTVSKSTQGSARIVRVGQAHELRLQDVEVAAEGAHVYLVGLDDAPSSAAVDQAELKYDMGALEQPNQVIPLPSEPDPTLRAVVLWSPRFGVNFGAASLRAP